MAATLKVRSGSSFQVEFRYESQDGTLIDTTGSPARMQFRSSSRVILSITERDVADPNPGSVYLARLEPGRWELFLGKSITKTLPPAVYWELELVPSSHPEDTESIASGVIMVEPEKVITIE